MSSWTLRDGTWEDLLERAARAANPLSVIVASRLADDRLWSQGLNRGGYNVLLKPFRAMEVLRDVNLAWLQWKQQDKRKVAGGTA